MKCRRILTAWCVLWTLQLAVAENTDRITVEPADNGAALINPDMGWTMHFYSNIPTNYGSKLAPSDNLADFPGCSTVYLRVPWSMLEPAEGQYDWSLFDTPAQRWISRGGKIAIRVTCTESWMRWATPKWVHDAGAKGTEFDYGKGPRAGGDLWEPDYMDPIFLDKLDRFLAAMAARYDGNSNVAFIDVGSFGMWGEGHTGFSIRLNQQQTDEITRKHIDLYLKHFKHTQVCISDDVSGHASKGPHQPITDYALQRGVTLRDDSIMVQPPPNSWYHTELMQAFWPRMPVIIEHEHYGSSKARGAWSGDRLVKSVEDYHASYMSIHWWPDVFLRENRDAIDHINRRLGYRLQLRQITWPKQVALGEPFDVSMTWANAGVAPCYPGGFAALTLKDDKGGIVSVHVDASFDMRKLEVGPPDKTPTRQVKSSATIGHRTIDPRGTFHGPFAPGQYDVYISVGKRDGTPVIALPLDHDDGQRRYKLGRITVKPYRQ